MVQDKVQKYPLKKVNCSKFLITKCLVEISLSKVHSNFLPRMQNSILLYVEVKKSLLYRYDRLLIHNLSMKLKIINCYLLNFETHFF